MSSRKVDLNEYTPSKYQVAIFDFIKNGKGNLVVEAAAGSGKTWTLVNAIKLIPKDKSILFVAFNKDIVVELQKKTSQFDNVKVMTMHSLGYKMLRDTFPDQYLEVNQFKYDAYIHNNIRTLSPFCFRKVKRGNFGKYISNIRKYVNYARFYLCETSEDFDFIEERYDIDTLYDEKEVAQMVMAWGMDNLESVDYTDMVWLPNVIEMCKTTYDFILADECQDINKAERMLILQCFKENTRMISVGDTNQAIYSFAGSDPDSFEELKKLPNTTCLPLSISYRCARTIVTFANKIVPTIEPNTDGREGRVIYNVPLEDIKDGDMVVCRNNAPLAKVYNDLLEQGKKAFIRGRDVGLNLTRLIKGTKQLMLNVDCSNDGVFARLYYDLFQTRNRLMDINQIDEKLAMESSSIQSMLDSINTLELLSNGLKTAQELIDKIESIFSEGGNDDGISLSTIHKAKGLESDRVFIICPSLMPSKSAKKDWEVRQERNLMYVAYTRAKNLLGFIDEDETEDFDAESELTIAALRRKEALVNLAICEKTTMRMTTDDAIQIAKRAKPLILSSNKANTIKIGEPKSATTFSELVGKKLAKTNKRKKNKMK